MKMTVGGTKDVSSRMVRVRLVPKHVEFGQGSLTERVRPRRPVDVERRSRSEEINPPRNVSFRIKGK